VTSSVSAVTEFMVRVLHSTSAVGICDVTGLEARHSMQCNPCLLGALFTNSRLCKFSVQTLKVLQQFAVSDRVSGKLVEDNVVDNNR
jgi:hypothetical protein